MEPESKNTSSLPAVMRAVGYIIIFAGILTGIIFLANFGWVKGEFMSSPSVIVPGMVATSIMMISTSAVMGLILVGIAELIKQKG